MKYKMARRKDMAKSAVLCIELRACEDIIFRAGIVIHATVD